MYYVVLYCLVKDRSVFPITYGVLRSFVCSGRKRICDMCCCDVVFVC